MADVVKFRCPECGYSGRFNAYAPAKVVVLSDGRIEEIDPGWVFGELDSSKLMTCRYCGHDGRIDAFVVPDRDISRSGSYATSAEAQAFRDGIELVNDPALTCRGPYKAAGHWVVDIYDADET